MTIPTWARLMEANFCDCGEAACDRCSSTAAFESLKSQVDLTDPNCPVGVAMTRAAIEACNACDGDDWCPRCAAIQLEGSTTALCDRCKAVRDADQS